jgi:hypothetical protein
VTIEKTIPAFSLFKDYFAHELRAHDISNFRPIRIPLHTLLVVNSSSLTKHFVCFLLIQASPHQS